MTKPKTRAELIKDIIERKNKLWPEGIPKLNSDYSRSPNSANRDLLEWAANATDEELLSAMKGEPLKWTFLGQK
jgi:hypothetical protein